MFWLLIWVVWAIYCVFVVPTWCFVYVALRQSDGRVRAWAIASLLALLWPVFWPQFKRWQRQNRPMSPGEQIAHEFKAVYG